MWYDDSEAHEAMATIGLYEIEKGRWISPDGLKEIADFEGGVIMTTRLVLDRPEFDVQTIHLGDDKGIEFLNECLHKHIKDIGRRTEEVLRRGPKAIIDRPKS